MQKNILIVLAVFLVSIGCVYGGLVGNSYKEGLDQYYHRHAGNLSGKDLEKLESFYKKINNGCPFQLKEKLTGLNFPNIGIIKLPKCIKKFENADGYGDFQRNVYDVFVKEAQEEIKERKQNRRSFVAKKQTQLPRKSANSGAFQI